MSTPPMNEGPSDELVEAYRRASIDDPSHPSRHIRDAILAQARQSVELGSEVRARIPKDHTVPAANDAQWAWKVVAGIAVVGLVGLLVAQSFRSFPQRVAPGVELRSAERPDAVFGVTAGAKREGVSGGLVAKAEPGGAAERSVADTDLSARGTATTTGTASDTATVTATSAGEPRAPAVVAAPVPAGRNFGTETGWLGALTEARGAGHGVLPSEHARSTVRRVVRARYADLFKPAGSDTVNLVTVYMNDHGDIDRARVEEISGGAVDAATLTVPDRFVALGLKRDEIGSIGFDRLVEAHGAQHQADAILLVLYAWPRRPNEPVP
jgi:hypothetical protein